MMKWLDPQRTTWSQELQSILKPYEGELECYPVPKEVGKVGNNSPDFILPISNKEKKGNIASFFATAGKKGEQKDKEDETESKGLHAKADLRETKDHEWSEDNAPKPVPKEEEVDEQQSPRGIKRERSPEDAAEVLAASKAVKTDETSTTSPFSPFKEKKEMPPMSSPVKSGLKSPSGKAMSAAKKKGSSDGSQPITNFFKK